MARERNKSKAKNVDRTGLSVRGKETLAMLTALEDEDGLSEWEKGFVSSVSDWFLLEQKPLTEKQFTRLEFIYRKFN